MKTKYKIVVYGLYLKDVVGIILPNKEVEIKELDDKEVEISFINYEGKQIEGYITYEQFKNGLKGE